MSITYEQLFKLSDSVGKDVLTTLKPYLPALARGGKQLLDDFLKSFKDKDWAKIDKLMYEQMTIEERRELGDKVFADARQAAIDRLEMKKAFEDVLMKTVLGILLKLI